MPVYELSPVNLHKHLMRAAFRLILKLFKHVKFFIANDGILVEQPERSNQHLKRDGSVYSHVYRYLIDLAKHGVVCDFEILTRYVLN